MRDGIPLHGHERIDAWRARVADYPEAPAVALVEEGLDLRSQERLEMLAARDDLFLLHRDLVDVAPPHEAVRILSGPVDDTYRLASRHVPAADLEPLRAAFELRRVTEQAV
ncbi:hypothetical protein [Terrabacter sp. NPDC080008]|uniref:hypothetical protein n=1 Tax=Terrabacter sp. NPDC080008 TaxID=3155176 RepID=UPI00344C85A6